MPQKILCGKCGFVLYNAMELEAPQETIYRRDGKCPQCSKKLEYDGVPKIFGSDRDGKKWEKEIEINPERFEEERRSLAIAAQAAIANMSENAGTGGIGAVENSQARNSQARYRSNPTGKNMKRVKESSDSGYESKVISR